ncbi:hypothetical protein LIER_02242 [Lithospermum erythrorhizon]|uniref:Integrase catalytic domain-containing protein n=1 Tax=Lithospermum erythrorhizon TaxID=34254 RepID=A0AAV3NNP2_LITER
MLNPNNYYHWRRSVEISLLAKNKLGFVNGECVRPLDPVQAAQWDRCNGMVISWLLHSIDRDIAESVIYCETVEKIWQQLHNRYSQANHARIYQIHRDLATSSQGNRSIFVYFTHLQRLWDEYVNMIVAIDESAPALHKLLQNQQIMQLLMGLNDSYTARKRRGQILMLKPFPALDNILQMLLQEEKQREVCNPSTLSTDASAMCTHKPFNGSRGRGVLQGNYGRGRDTFGYQGRARPALFCDYCKMHGHSMQKCYKLNAIQGGKLQHKLIQVLCFFKSAVSNLWILDSGAIDHITPYLSLFASYKPVPFPMFITISNGSNISIKHYGTVRLSPHLTLQNVLHIPDFHYNLLSIHKLTADLQKQIIFTREKCVLQDHSQREHLVLGKSSKGLYILDTQCLVGVNSFICFSTGSLNSSDCYLIASSTSTNDDCHNHQSVNTPSVNNTSNVILSSKDTLLWHYRLGHLPFEQFTHIIALPKPNSKVNEQCRNTFQLSTTRSQKIFQLIYIDTWGPYKHATYNSFHYVLTIVDDYSRMTWTHLISSKSNAFPILKAFIIFVQTQFHTNVQTIRSDNELEFCSHYATQFYAEQGIVHHTSCQYTPQQNGVVERMHKHFLEIARALLFQSNVPIQFWGECILTATYVVNHFPMPSLQHTTPFELLFNSLPTYNHMRSFGCLCYIGTKAPGRSKFDSRSHVCVFLGYPFGKKAYKVFNLVTKEVIVSRDVRFIENCYPFQSKILPNDTTLPTLNFASDFDFPTSIFYPTRTTPNSNPMVPEFLDVGHNQFPITSTTPPSDPPPSLNDPPRRSTRIHKPPSHLKDFICTGAQSLFDSTYYFDQSFFKTVFHVSIDTYSEPCTYKQAVNDPRCYVSGCSGLILKRMVAWKGLRPDLLLRVLHKGKALIIMRCFPQL